MVEFKRYLAMCIVASVLMGCATQQAPKAAVEVKDAKSMEMPETISSPPPTVHIVTPPKEPVSIAPAPHVNSGLLGKTYAHAFVLPRRIAKKWTVEMHMILGEESHNDFILLRADGNLTAAVGARGKHLGGSSYVYTIVDQLPLPNAVAGSRLTRCAITPGGNKSVLASVVGRKPHHRAVWAVLTTDSDKIHTLAEGELADLHCTEKARLIK